MGFYDDSLLVLAGIHNEREKAIIEGEAESKPKYEFKVFVFSVSNSQLISKKLYLIIIGKVN